MAEKKSSSSRNQQSKAPPPRLQTAGGRYWDATQQPLYCLLFLFPIVATYEFGALLVRPLAWPEQQLVAHVLLRQFFGWFGVGGFWLPGAALLLTLLIWHWLSRQPWQIQGWVLPLMFVESLVLTVPLFVLERLLLTWAAHGLQHAPPAADLAAALTATFADSGGLRGQIVLALGAGVYEELLFRFFLITGLLLLFSDLLRVPRALAAGLAAGLAAALFAFCHVQPIGAEPFVWPSFLLRLAAGGYLSLIFIGRGLGVATGCHAAYNLILLWMQEAA